MSERQSPAPSPSSPFPSSPATSILRVCALYPGLMNIYADRGNLLMLERRCAWRSIEWQLHESSLGAALSDEHDLYYIGGGQDADQRRCASDLLERKAAALHAAAPARARGRRPGVLGCGGRIPPLRPPFQPGPETVPGIRVLDVHTGPLAGARL